MPKVVVSVPRYEMTTPKIERDYTWRVCVATSIAYAAPFATCLRCELAVVCVAYRRSEENMLKNSDKSLSVLCVFANGGRLGRKYVKNGAVSQLAKNQTVSFFRSKS